MGERSCSVMIGKYLHGCHLNVARFGLLSAGALLSRILLGTFTRIASVHIHVHWKCTNAIVPGNPVFALVRMQGHAEETQSGVAWSSILHVVRQSKNFQKV